MEQAEHYDNIKSHGKHSFLLYVQVDEESHLPQTYQYTQHNHKIVNVVPLYAQLVYCLKWVQYYLLIKHIRFGCLFGYFRHHRPHINWLRTRHIIFSCACAWPTKQTVLRIIVDCVALILINVIVHLHLDLLILLPIQKTTKFSSAIIIDTCSNTPTRGDNRRGTDRGVEQSTSLKINGLVFLLSGFD